MISSIHGNLLEKTPPLVLIECAGVGYEMLVPMSTFYQLVPLGQTQRLLTHLIVREDAHTLYGFGSAQERSSFRDLIKISGVGPRTALSILSGLSISELQQAVTQQDSVRLTKVPGIGKKTAERLLLELKGKMGESGGAIASVQEGPQGDILQALIALGYAEREALSCLKSLPAEVSVSEGIRLALKNLVK